jgi:hypothetical protein
VNPRYGLSGKVTVVSKHFFQFSLFLVWSSSRRRDLDLTYVKRPFVGMSLRRKESCLISMHMGTSTIKTDRTSSQFVSFVIVFVVVSGLAISIHRSHSWPSIGVFRVGVPDI